MIIPEEKEQGTISTKTYYHYFRAGATVVFMVAVIVSLFLGEVSILLLQSEHKILSFSIGWNCHS